MGVLDQLSPADFFHYFEEISRIPRPSYHEKQISDYLVSFAKSRGLSYVQDDVNNVILIKEASPGREHEPAVILQGHMDMVAEKDPGCEIDLTKEPITLAVAGDLITAEHTTLGADDGFAVAAMLALLSDQTLSHPRLECVITVSEETGMEGAFHIDLSMLKGRRLINMDAEEEGVFLVSCAGGSTAQLTLPIARTLCSGSLCRIRITGLCGGHSGIEIHKGRANANQLLARLLLAFPEPLQPKLFSMSGGTKNNAIPREAILECIILPDKIAEIREFAEKFNQEIITEYVVSDPEISLSVEIPEENVQRPCLTPEAAKNTVLLMNLLPNGVISMHMEGSGLVKTSLNFGILSLDDQELSLEYLLRSASGSERAYLERRMALLADSVGAAFSISQPYPAWEWKPDSPLRDALCQVYQELYHEKPQVTGIHAGLECGILSGKLTGLDAVAIGPDLTGVHTTAETMSISSAGRVYALVRAFLEHTF